MTRYWLLSGLSLASLFSLPGCDQPKPATPEVKVEQPAADPAPAPVANEKKVPITKRRTSELVEKTQAMAANPNFYVTENKITAFDPLSSAFQGYVNAASRVNLMALKHNMDLIKATEERHLTFVELQEYIKVNNVTMNALPEYQTYAYDEKTGEFMVLEDGVHKEKFYAEARGD